MTSGYFERELTRLRIMTQEARSRLARVAEGLADVRQQLTASADGRADEPPVVTRIDKSQPVAVLRPEILFK